MVKKIIIDEEFIKSDEHSGRSRGHRPFGDHEEGYKRHHNKNFMKYPNNFGPKIVETKLFVSKEELVEYVNEKGQSDAIIDIYKIEDGLYKLVIKKIK